MTRRDFSKFNSRRNAIVRGFEPAAGGLPLFGVPATRPSKSAMRDELATVIDPDAAIVKIIQCKCGHEGRIKIALSKSRGPFRCGQCGRKTT